ncbi:G-protein coupled receptor 4 [Anabarilius grahami]|uniref:G-protein coupled receptor 4 n=1 Tax=Anabarilius grahami TaxID=495550 RepID=A0A3N0XU09_ANAGA|nr:G-protein coupled receptor 4 [Anabarilius grahami]
MNISSAISSNDESNFSDHNSTKVQFFEMASLVDILTILLSFPTNSYVIWLIVTGTGNGLAAEFFSLNLAVCEIFFSMESILSLLMYNFQILWMAVEFLDGLAITGRPVFQCLICFERYLAVITVVSHSEDMDVPSEIFTADGSNFSDHLFFNDTGVEIGVEKIIYIITIVFGLPTNSYVIWLIVTGLGNGLSAEFFSLNLSVCEIFLCLTNVFYFFSHSFVLIIVFLYGQGISITGRPVFQCLMCVERYLAVVHPVTFLKFKPLRYRVICSVFAWTAMFASCGLNVLLIFFELFDFFYYFMLAQLFLFIFIQLFCLVAVLRALKQLGPGERGREKEEENHMKRRAFHIILITTVTMVIIYAPSIIAGLIFLSSDCDYDTIASIAESSFSLGGLVQPFLFVHRVGKLPFQLH